jgi:hypothetical protein
MVSVGVTPADTHPMLSLLLDRRVRRSSSTLGSGHSRIEVRPPPGDGQGRWWERLQGWLNGDVPLAVPLAEVDRVEAVRREFALAIGDLEGLQAGSVLMRINTARTLRELWHLRTAVYGAIALELSQCEAEFRLARLNRHFPTRAPRSAFAPLER